MFTDEDLFTISITANNKSEAGGKGKRVSEAGCQTEPQSIADKETTTLNATNSVEIQADPTEGEQIAQLTEEQYNAEELEGFLRTRFRYITNSLKEYSVLQSSKRKNLILSKITGQMGENS